MAYEQQQQDQQGQGQGQGQDQQSEIPGEELTNASFNDIQTKAFQRNKIPDKLLKYMDMDNIADSLDEDTLESIGEVVYEGHRLDKESRKEWEEVMEDAFEIIAMNPTEKTTPWTGAANIKYPLIISACMQFNARTNPQIIKNNKVVEVRQIIVDDPEHKISDRAKRQSDHMSYQLLGQSTHWTSDTDKLLMMLPMMGVVYRKSFFNPIVGQPDTILCLPDDIIINDNVSSLDAAQRITHVQYLTTNEIIENMKAEIFKEYPIEDLGLSVLQGDDFNKLKDKDLDNTPDSRQSETFTTKDSNKHENLLDVKHCVFEQCRWLDLDGDLYQEPYIATIHRDTKKVLRIVARYDRDSFEFNKDGKFTKIKIADCASYYTDFHFIPNPNGTFHSIGFGSILLPLNAAINSLFNQLIDAGTLSNLQCGFLGNQLRLDSGDFSFRPGEWKKINTVGGDGIANSVFPMPTKEPSQTLFALLQFLIDSSRQITAITDVMAGDLPAANTPAATTMALLEQSQQVYSSILYRIYEALKKEFKKLYALNKKYLSDIETFPLAEGMGVISRQDYLEPNYGVFPVADPKLSSQMQIMTQVQALLQLLGQPEMNRIEVLKEYLKALKFQDPTKYLIIKKPDDPPSMAEKVAEADLRAKNMGISCMLMDRELQAIALSLEEGKQMSQAANYGVRAAKDKISSIVDLAKMHSEVEDRDIQKAVKEEEVLTDVSQDESIPEEQYAETQKLKQFIGQLMTGAQINTPEAQQGMKAQMIGEQANIPSQGDMPQGEEMQEPGQ